MLRGYDGGVKCPKCDNRLAMISEKSAFNGGTIVRYILKCSSCGYRDVLQEVYILRSEDTLRVKVSAPLKSGPG